MQRQDDIQRAVVLQVCGISKNNQHKFKDIIPKT